MVRFASSKTGEGPFAEQRGGLSVSNLLHASVIVNLPVYSVVACSSLLLAVLRKGCAL